MPLQRSLVDLSRLAASVVEALRVLQPDRPIALECLATCTCICDADLMRRVLENLVSNAMKHTGRHGQVRVVISGSAQLTRIAVHDEGAGVVPEQRDRIFEVYATSAAPGTPRFESSGVGLAFCRLAVEAHGGTIRVENAVPQGAIFVIELPRDL